jgi:hypothetical protein
MVLNIDNIQKMNHNIFCGREVTAVQSKPHFGTHHYTFHFPTIEGYTPAAFSQWEDAFVIHLVREPKNGSYELYWMGLHSVTCQQLHKSEIQNFQTFYSYFEKVIRLGKEYWEESKGYRI